MNTISDTRSSRALLSKAEATLPLAACGLRCRVLDGNLVAPRDPVREADRNREGARNDERHAPAAVVDQVAGDQRGARDAEIAPHAVHGEPHAGVLPFLRHHRETDRMVDRGEHADHEQPDPDLQRRLRKSGRDRGEPDADEEHDHHALAAPFVREPAGRIREHAEREEAGRRVFEQFAVAELPFARERQRRDGREDQREQMIEEVPDVEEQEMRAIAIHGCPGQSADGR